MRIRPFWNCLWPNLAFIIEWSVYGISCLNIKHWVAFFKLLWLIEPTNKICVENDTLHCLLKEPKYYYYLIELTHKGALKMIHITRDSILLLFHFRKFLRPILYSHYRFLDEVFIQKYSNFLFLLQFRIAGHPLAQNERCLHMFLQEPNIDRNYVPGKIRNA